MKGEHHEQYRKGFMYKLNHGRLLKQSSSWNAHMRLKIRIVMHECIVNGHYKLCVQYDIII